MNVFGNDTGAISIDISLSAQDGDILFFGGDHYARVFSVGDTLYLMVLDEQSAYWVGNMYVTESVISAGAHVGEHTLRLEWSPDGTNLLVDSVQVATTPHFLELSAAELLVAPSYDATIKNLYLFQDISSTEPLVFLPLLTDENNVVTGTHQSPPIDLTSIEESERNFFYLEGTAYSEVSFDFGETWSTVQSSEVAGANDQVVLLKHQLAAGDFIKAVEFNTYADLKVISEITTDEVEVLSGDPGVYSQPLHNNARKGVRSCRVPVFGDTLSFTFRKEGQLGYLFATDSANAQFTPSLSTTGATVSYTPKDNSFTTVTVTFNSAVDYVYLLSDLNGTGGVKGRVDDISTEPLPADLVSKAINSVRVSDQLNTGIVENGYKAYSNDWQIM